MGNGCCSKEGEQKEDEAQLCTDMFSEELTKGIMTTRTINEIKTIDVHQSKKNGKAKLHLKIKLDRAPLSKKSSRDRLGLLDVNPPAFNKMETICRLPTNFKIGAPNFRHEKKGTLEDKYTVEKVIGKGAFGEVKRIKEKITGLYKAVKVMAKDNCQKTDNFADEIEIIKQLVQIYN
jgi:hypothetical protein